MKIPRSSHRVPLGAFLAGAALLVVPPSDLRAAAKPTIEKKIQCLAPCGRPIASAPGFTTIVYTLTISNNDLGAPLDLQVIDDLPAGALDYRVVDRGNRTPCGAPGNPTCANIPAPGGANGAGQIVLNNFHLADASKPLGSSLTVKIEVDLSCPPLVDKAPVANQAKVYTPGDPTTCNPCLSDDPSSPAVDDPTVFTAACQAAPSFVVTKVPDRTEWRPGDPQAINYTLTITNTSTSAVLLGADLAVLDLMPKMSTGYPAYVIAATCPVKPTYSPNPAVPPIVDNTNCDAINGPTVRFSYLPDIPPGGSFTMFYPITIRDDLNDQYDFCNNVSVSGTNGYFNTKGCTTVVVPLPADFRNSVKTVSPDPVVVGAPVSYNLTITNSGTGPGNNVVVLDTLPACIDAGSFDPARDVSVSPGPPRSTPTYNSGTRQLTVLLPNMAPGQTQTISLSGLRAGATAGACCNQAFVLADGINAPGHPTGDTAGSQQQTCTVITVPAGPSFQQSVKTMSPNPASVGGPVTMNVTVTNTGGGAGSSVVFTDVFSNCLDASGFDPLTDVTISPGPGSANYNVGTRTLTVQLGSMAPSSTQSITVTGLVGGPATSSCCNQGRITSNEVPPPGQATGATAGAGNPTCIAIDPVSGGGCTVNLQDIASPLKTSPPWVYTQSCPSGDPRLPDNNPVIMGTPGDWLVDTLPPQAGWALKLYQFDCTCSQSSKMYKKLVPPGNPEVHWVF